MCILLTLTTYALSAPIHVAASKDNVARVKTLLKKSPKLLNARDKDQSTPLHYAVISGKTGVLKFLLSKNAQVNLKRNDGATPLHVAVAMRKKDVINMLVRKGAKADLSNMVINFPKGSIVTRNGKKIAGMQKGGVLKSDDVISGGSNGNLDIYIGSLAAIRVKPATQVSIQKVEKIKGGIDVQIRLRNGTLLTRLRKLTGQSRFILETPGAVAAARGTAYLTKYENNITEVLVAEGQVAVSLTDAPAQEVVVGESQKVEVDKILPVVATTVTAFDSDVVKELLSVQPPQNAVVVVNPKDGAELVWVPAGEFIMGSTEAQVAAMKSLLSNITNPGPAQLLESEKPQHKVYLDGYWVYKNEVTVAQYRKFCTETSKTFPDAPKWGWIDSHPIVNVTWQDAVDYAKWAGTSLLTEAQWEKASRGPDGRTYPWGDQWDTSKCNEVSRGPNRTQPVGSYPNGKSPYGCMDMAGNVWEWCADWYAPDYYNNTPGSNPTGPSDGVTRVLRGSSWTNANLYDYPFQCAHRHYYNPTEHEAFIGFRCGWTP